jgi:hypothetical protein
MSVGVMPSFPSGQAAQIEEDIVSSRTVKQMIKVWSLRGLVLIVTWLSHHTSPRGSGAALPRNLVFISPQLASGEHQALADTLDSNVDVCDHWLLPSDLIAFYT